MTLGPGATHSLGCVIFPALLLRAGAEPHAVLPLILKDAVGSLLFLPILYTDKSSEATCNYLIHAMSSNSF